MPTAVHSLPTPLPYLRDIVAFLQREEPHVWRWFADVEHTRAQSEAVRLSLLKSTYRLDRNAHAELYEQAAALQERLQISAPLTIYQAHNAHGGINAALWFMPDEIHIVLQGSLLTTLNKTEIAAVVAHELSHYYLWTIDNGAYAIADRILSATCDHPQVESEHIETARRWQLMCEIFADRAALLVTGDSDAVVRTLVRIETGAASVDVPSYLKQAQEVVAGGVIAEGTTHPECFIRALAVQMMDTDNPAVAEKQLRLVSGPLDPLTVDVLDQQRLGQLTTQVLSAVINPAWMRSEAVLNLARQYFPAFEPGGQVDDLSTHIIHASTAVRDYICFVLLDIATADHNLAEHALAHVLVISQRWNCQPYLSELITRELKRPAKKVAELVADAPRLITEAEQKVLTDKESHHE